MAVLSASRGILRDRPRPLPRDIGEGLGIEQNTISEITLNMCRVPTRPENR
jgi:hypothetical protein